jgi:hypothetical protein
LFHLARRAVQREELDDLLLLHIDPRPRFRIPPVNVVLFVLTLFSIYFVPVF